MINSRQSIKKVRRKDDQHLYKERHLVECFINKIKQYRRIFRATRNWPVAILAFQVSSLPSSGSVEMSTRPSFNLILARCEKTQGQFLTHHTQAGQELGDAAGSGKIARDLTCLYTCLPEFKDIR